MVNVTPEELASHIKHVVGEDLSADGLAALEPRLTQHCPAACDTLAKPTQKGRGGRS